MNAVEAGAPGKVVIAGEYAVLHDAPAIVMAVDRRASVSVTPAGGASSTVRAPGFARGERAFRGTPGGIEWLDGGAGWSVLDAAWAEVQPDLAGPLNLVLDTQAFHAGGDGPKLGIGSSAALTVATVAALDAAAGAGVDVAAAAFAAHGALGSAGGSGVDVAAALSGGLVQYTMAGRRCRMLAWPAPVRFALYWSGTAADTVAGIERYRRNATPEAHAVLGDAAERAAAAWAQGDVTGILVETRRFAEELARIDEKCDLGIFAAGHRELVAAANGDVVYKPCGAGGGDIGIALAASGDAIETFSARAGDLGYKRLSLLIEAQGVTVTGAHG